MARTRLARGRLSLLVVNQAEIKRFVDYLPMFGSAASS
jgi:hypothetical protein